MGRYIEEMIARLLTADEAASHKAAAAQETGGRPLREEAAEAAEAAAAEAAGEVAHAADALDVASAKVGWCRLTQGQPQVSPRFTALGLSLKARI